MSRAREKMRELMIDSLYGELHGERLAELEQALRESPALRDELAALQATLQVARDQLARDPDPPPRARERVLEAARAARPARAEPAERSFGSRLRSTLILPSLIAAAAAALLVFRPSDDPRPALAPTASSPNEAAARPADQSEQGAPPASAPAVTAPGSGAATSSGQAEPAGTPGTEPATRKRGTARFAEPPAAWQRPRRAVEPEAQPPSAAHAEVPRTTSAAEGRARGARAPTRTELPAAEAAETSDDDLLMDSVRDSASAPSAMRRAEPELAPAPAPALQLTAAALERRAREHAAAQRWHEAAADYRELLRRFSQDTRRGHWAEQLALALRAAPEPAPRD